MVNERKHSNFREEVETVIPFKNIPKLRSEERPSDLDGCNMSLKPMLKALKNHFNQSKNMSENDKMLIFFSRIEEIEMQMNYTTTKRHQLKSYLRELKTLNKRLELIRQEGKKKDLGRFKKGLNESSKLKTEKKPSISRGSIIYRRNLFIEDVKNFQMRLKDPQGREDIQRNFEIMISKIQETKNKSSGENKPTEKMEDIHIIESGKSETEEIIECSTRDKPTKENKNLIPITISSEDEGIQSFEMEFSRFVQSKLNAKKT